LTGNTLVFAANQTSMVVGIVGGTSALTCSVSSNAIVSNDVRYSGVQLSSSSFTVNVIPLGTITPSVFIVNVAPYGRANQTIQLSLSDVPTSSVTLALTVPSNVIVVEGNLVTFAAGSQTTSFTVAGLASSNTSISQSITFGLAVSNDVRFSGVQAQPSLPVTVVTYGVISVANNALRVSVNGVSTSSLTLTLSSIPTADVRIPVSVADGVSLTFTPSYVLIPAGSSSGYTTVAGGSTATSVNVVFGGAVTTEPHFVGEVPSSTVSVAVVNQGIITSSLGSNYSLAVEQSGGSLFNFTLYFNPAPASPITFTMIPPSTIFVYGGNAVTVTALSTYVSISLVGGSSLSDSLPLGISPLVSADPVYNGANISFANSLTVSVVASVLIPTPSVVNATYIYVTLSISPDIVFGSLAAVQLFETDVLADFGVIMNILPSRLVLTYVHASNDNSQVIIQVAVVPNPNDPTTPDQYMAIFLVEYGKWVTTTNEASTLAFASRPRLKLIPRNSSPTPSTGYVTLTQCGTVYRIACEVEESSSNSYLEAGLSITFVFLFVVIVIFIVLCHRHRKKQKLAREKAAISKSTRAMTAVGINGNGATNGTSSVNGRPSTSAGHHQRASVSEPGYAISPMSIQTPVRSGTPSASATASASGNGKRRTAPVAATAQSPLLRSDDSKRLPVDSSSMHVPDHRV